MRVLLVALLAAWTMAAPLPAEPLPLSAGGITEVNVVAWPAAPSPSPDGVDLCRAPLMDALCAADLERRAGERGERPLHGRRLVSRVNGDGEVEWLWRGRAVAEPVAFRLADGQRVVLRLPSADPPRVEPPAPSAAPPEVPADVPDSSDEIAETRDEGAGTWWREPLPLIALPALVLALGVALLRRRTAARPRRRTSFVRRVKPPEEPPIRILDLPLRGLSSVEVSPMENLSPEEAPRLSTGGGQARRPAPARDPVHREDDGVPPAGSAGVSPAPERRRDACAPSVASPSRTLRRELEALEDADREGVDRTLAAICRLRDWIGGLIPVLQEIEEGAHALVRLDSLPPPARREWREAAAALLRFAGVDVEALASLREAGGTPLDVPAVDRYLVESGLLSQELSPRQRLRRHLLSSDHGGRVSEVVLALQYLLEAFPVEQLDAPCRQVYRAELRERLQAAGLPGRLHPLIGELAAGLGLRYQEVRYYKTRIGEAGYELLENAHDTISLSELVGYEAATEDRLVVRLSEVFLFEAATGAYWSGRAAIDEG